MQAFNGIETLILISKRPLEDHGSLGGGLEGRRTSNRNGFEEQPNLPYPEKLLQAAATFINKSLKLHTVILDSVRVRLEMLASISSALSTTKSCKKCFQILFNSTSYSFVSLLRLLNDCFRNYYFCTYHSLYSTTVSGPMAIF